MWHALMGAVGVVGHWGRGVMWHRLAALVMASVGISEIDEHTLAWPKCGCSPGARWQRWQLRVLVVVVGGGGGGEKKDGKVTMCGVSDVSTAVAQFCNSQVPIVN